MQPRAENFYLSDYHAGVVAISILALLIALAVYWIIMYRGKEYEFKLPLNRWGDTGIVTVRPGIDERRLLQIFPPWSETNRPYAGEFVQLMREAGYQAEIMEGSMEFVPGVNRMVNVPKYNND